jgi:hypothetical protein
MNEWIDGWMDNLSSKGQGHDISKERGTQGETYITQFPDDFFVFSIPMSHCFIDNPSDGSLS